MKVSPCKGCIEHEFGCRSGCSKYAEWEEEHKAEKEKIYKNRNEDIKFKGWKVETKKRVYKRLKTKRK